MIHFRVPEVTIARFDLSDAEWRQIKPLLPNKPRGVAWVDDRRGLNGISTCCGPVFALAGPAGALRPYTTVYNRFNRWARAGVWGECFREPGDQVPGGDGADRQFHRPRPPTCRRRKKRAMITPSTVLVED